MAKQMKNENGSGLNDTGPGAVDKKLKPDKGASNFKLINANGGRRVSQACDRCRIKKIKCDGLTPCLNCSKIGFDCKTSDKLTRRAFPKGYTENLENIVKTLEAENKRLKLKAGEPVTDDSAVLGHSNAGDPIMDMAPHNGLNPASLALDNDQELNDPYNKRVTLTTKNATVQINNPIDQIFNLNKKGIIIGNDNLNFESQFNHLLINLNLPFLKITNSHNYLLDDPDSYLYHPSSASYNQFHNKDLDVIYNPLTSNNTTHDDYLHELSNLSNSELPMDIYDLFIKLINNFKKIFSNKKQLDSQIAQFFLNYNVFIPIFDYKKFMESYDNFHTMYPFMFTYDDATINGFNILNNDYHVVNEYLMVVIQIYAMIMMNDPTINLNLLLNHSNPRYSVENRNTTTDPKNKNVIRSLYDFLPYFNVFHVSINLLQTYLLFLYFSLLTNNKEKSLVLSSLINAFIGILGINLNSKNLFFNDLSLNIQSKRDRVKIFWVFKVLLKCFNLKFGFKPSLNTTVINPVTIDRYFELTPEKLSLLLELDSRTRGPIDNQDDEHIDELFKTLLKPSVEFLNLINIIIPSSFSPNYYQYLKGDNPMPQKKSHPKNLEWILNDEDGDGNDGNLNYNFAQFQTIDRNLTEWRESLKTKELNLLPLQLKMNLPKVRFDPTEFNPQVTNLYHSINISDIRELENFGISGEGYDYYMANGAPDIDTAVTLIKIQLNFHYLLIRSQNYLNFIVDKELNTNYYTKILSISKEFLEYFIIIFGHVSRSLEDAGPDSMINQSKHFIHHNPHSTGTNPVILGSLGLDVDEDGFVINDFSAKRRRTSHQLNQELKARTKTIPENPFNFMLNGLSMTVINLKKTIVLQMLYLLICCIRFVKKDNKIDSIVPEVLNTSIDLFIKCFINYQVNAKPYHVNAKKASNKVKEDDLFKKLMNDELRDQILSEQRNNNDDENPHDLNDYNLEFDSQLYFSNFNQIGDIDWDDEDMDEDLKYLKILKFVKYKMNQIKELSKKRQQFKRKEQHKKEQPKPAGPKDGPKPEAAAQPEPIQLLVPPPIPGKHGLFSMPGPPSIHNFGSNPAPESSPKFPLTKMPSISKLDYLLPDENFPTHTFTGTTFPPSKFKEYVASPSKDDDELMKREKLAINDLMSLKKGHHTPAHSPTGAAQSPARSP